MLKELNAKELNATELNATEFCYGYLRAEIFLLRVLYMLLRKTEEHRLMHSVFHNDKGNT